MTLVQYSEYLLSTVDTDVLVLQHQGISSYSADYAPIHLQLFMAWTYMITCDIFFVNIFCFVGCVLLISNKADNALEKQLAVVMIDHIVTGSLFFTQVDVINSLVPD